MNAHKNEVVEGQKQKENINSHPRNKMQYRETETNQSTWSNILKVLKDENMHLEFQTQQKPIQKQSQNKNIY